MLSFCDSMISIIFTFWRKYTVVKIHTTFSHSIYTQHIWSILYIFKEMSNLTALRDVTLIIHALSKILKSLNLCIHRMHTWSSEDILCHIWKTKSVTELCNLNKITNTALMFQFSSWYRGLEDLFVKGRLYVTPTYNFRFYVSCYILLHQKTSFANVFPLT